MQIKVSENDFRNRLALEKIEPKYIKKQNFSTYQKPCAEHDFGTIKKTDPLTAVSWEKTEAAVFQKCRFSETLEKLKFFFKKF